MTLTLQTDLAHEIKERSGENVFLCYQCKKCTAGCPVAAYFDLTPNQVLRACQFGQTDMVLNSRTIWICAACETCSTRCPQGIDIARIMDVLEIMAQEQKIRPKARTVPMFYKSANRGIGWFGRMWELGLMAELYIREFLAGEPPRKQFFRQLFRYDMAHGRQDAPCRQAQDPAEHRPPVAQWPPALPPVRSPRARHDARLSGGGQAGKAGQPKATSSPTTPAVACTPPASSSTCPPRPWPRSWASTWWSRGVEMLRHIAGPQHRPLPLDQAADGNAGHRPGDGSQLHDHALRRLLLSLPHRHARGPAGSRAAKADRSRDRLRVHRRHQGRQPVDHHHRSGGIRDCGQAGGQAAGRVEGGLLLRLPAHPPARRHRRGALRVPHQHGPPGRGAGRRGPGLDLQDRLLRRLSVAQHARDRPGPEPQDPEERPGRGRRPDRHCLPAVPCQPRPAPEADQR